MGLGEYVESTRTADALVAAEVVRRDQAAEELALRACNDSIEVTEDVRRVHAALIDANVSPDASFVGYEHRQEQARLEQEVQRSGGTRRYAAANQTAEQFAQNHAVGAWATGASIGLGYEIRGETGVASHELFLGADGIFYCLVGGYSGNTRTGLNRYPIGYHTYVPGAPNPGVGYLEYPAPDPALLLEQGQQIRQGLANLVIRHSLEY